MFNTLKNKITIGLVFLFALLLLSGGVGIYNIYKLRKEAKGMIQANYETLNYCQGISVLLDSLPSPENATEIESLIKLQQNNITEIGENEATENLVKHWNKLKQNYNVKVIYVIHGDLNLIEQLNMQAIERKNSAAEKTADKALLVIIVISTLILISALIFLFRFPDYVTKPLKKLTKGIKEIANKNYNHKINIQKDVEMIELAEAFNEMSEKLNEYEKSNVAKLMFEKSRAEAVINSLKDASIGIDNDLRVLFANAQALQLMNIKAEAIVAKNAIDVAKVNDLFNYIINNEQSSPFKIVVNYKDCFFTKEKSEINIQGKIIGTLYTIKNITSFQEKDIAKTNFLATISHELKTPLSSTDIALKLLSNEKIGALNKEQQQLVNDLKGENQRLIKLVSELLDLSQAETGNINLNIMPVSLLDMVAYSIEALKALLQEKKLHIECLDITDKQFIKVDKEKASWVLINILSNAIRYSPEESTITIQISTQHNGLLVLSVQDKGAGIPKEFQKNLFQRFYKIPTPSGSKGTGLGLSIAKEFMEAMNGKIYLDTTYTSGTKFNLEFVSAD
jgi:NtrC-family two-component system sensor histidine kinase KinB